MTELRNRIWDINKPLMWAQQLACACVQKSPRAARRAGEAGWAEPHLTVSLHRTRLGSERLQKEWFPQRSRREAERPVNHLLCCWLSHSHPRVCFLGRSLCLLASHAVCYPARASALRKNPAPRDMSLPETSSAAPQAETVSCWKERPGRWLSRSSQGSHQGGESAGAD